MGKLLFFLVAIFATPFCRAVAMDSLFTVQGSKGNLAVHLQLPSILKEKKIPIVIICHGLTGHQDEPFISKRAVHLPPTTTWACFSIFLHHKLLNNNKIE